MKKHTYLFQILAVLLFISSSAWAQKTKKKSFPVLSGTYQLVKMRNYNTLEAIEPGKTNIVIDTKTNQFSANVGCNSISGEFKTQKNKISEPIIGCKQYCLTAGGAEVLPTYKEGRLIH